MDASGTGVCPVHTSKASFPPDRWIMLFRVPARMVVRRPAPINQLFNDESIAVQI